MQRTGHDSNLAASPAGAGLPGHVLDVVVLTAHAGLLATLREASGPEHAIWHAPSADTAVDLLVGGRCSLLIADLDTLRGDAAALLDRLHAQFPELIIMVTGRREEEGAVAALVGNGRIYRFLHKPVSPARAGLFLTAATRRYNELRPVEPIVLTTVKTIAKRPTFTRILVAVVVLIAAIVAFVLWQSGDEQSDLSQQSSLGAPTKAEQVADQLARAQIAYAAGRLTEPRGDNALEYFRAVLALEPGNADALAGMQRLVAVLESRLDEALQSRDAAQGAVAWKALQRAQPDHPRLDALQTELLSISRSARAPLSSSEPNASTATPPGSAQSASPASAAETSATDEATPLDSQSRDSGTGAAEIDSESARRDSPTAKELASVAALRERGALIEPAGANAYDELSKLRERDVETDALLTEQQLLVFALLDHTRSALAAGDVDAAARFASHADTLVPGMNATRALREEIAAARKQRAFMKNVVPATTLKRIREAPASYPREAQRDGVEGWVDVEFTVAPDGTTQDWMVRDARPPEVFDEAALDCVRRWRFEPVMRNGAAVPQRAVLRIRFALR